MEKKEALERLREYRNEIDQLKTLKHHNQEYQLWENRVKVVVKAAFGEHSDEYIYVSQYPRINIYWTDVEKQEEYIRTLQEYYVGITKILEKYDILGMPVSSEVNAVKGETERPKAFIAHGGESVALDKLSDFLNALGIDPLIVELKATKGKALDDKVEHYLGQADCAIILATGDDEINGKLHPRQNVIHETGLAQKSFPEKIIYLLENDAEFPSNISPKVWESFTKDRIEETFTAVVRELKAFGIMKAVKPQ